MTKKKIIKIAVISFIVLVILGGVWYFFLYPAKVFKENESSLESAGIRYYEVNRTHLPKDKGRVVSVSLNTLVKQKYLEGLYDAHNTMCDLNESNVKVVSNGNDYKYYTYLKCGKYESDVDHEGPTITLNGSKTIKVSKGEKFSDPGIKNVVDNVDGKINVSKVTIDGKVDTSKVGNYYITYSVSDSLRNKTEVIRKVVVEERLNSVVKKDTSNTNNYYQGMATNNYVMFNNMLFRIVKLNSDNTVTIVSDSPLANVDYTNNGRFMKSSLDSWLNDYFYDLLEDYFKDLIVSSKWCDGVLNSDEYMNKNCKRFTDKRKVGILSLEDYNNTLVNNSSFLDNDGLTWYANLDSKNNPWSLTSMYDYPLKTEAMNQEYLFNVRPALTLKKTTKILSGDGSYVDPYILSSKSIGKKGSQINKREIGEYVKYSGYLFRISNITDDDTTEVIMTDVLKNSDIEVNIGYNNGNGKKIYNPNEKGNIGYQVVNEMTRYISTKLFSKTKIAVPIYKNNVTYQGKKDLKTYTNLVTIPSVFDIFSAKGSMTCNGGYWYIESSKATNKKTVMNPVGSVSYMPVDDDKTAGVKVKAYLKKNVVITGGNGSLDNPYTITN